MLSTTMSGDTTTTGGDKFCSTVYVCECGYSTINKSNSNKHLKTNKCSERKITKKKVSFFINDDKILSLINPPEKTTLYEETDLEPAFSGESYISSVSHLSDRTDNSITIRPCNETPGLIYYAYDKSYAKRAIIDVAELLSQEELRDYYSNMFRDPDVISIYTHDIGKIEPMVKDSLRRLGMMDNNHVIHGIDSIRKFIDCVAECNISMCKLR